MSINREILKSSERIKRKKAETAFAYISLFLALIFALTNFIFHLDQLYIKEIKISGNKKVPADDIFRVAKNALAGKYYGLYPRNNILIYPKDAVGKSILRNIPWVASVGVVGAKNSIFIDVKEREPKYLWCDDPAKPILELTCYYLDKDGYTFDKSPLFSDHIYLEFYGGNKRGGYMGRYILPENILSGLLEVESSVEGLIKNDTDLLGRVYGIDIHNNGDYDLLMVNGDHRWKIMFNLNVNVPKKLSAVLTSPFFITEIKNKDRVLQYIDLRFGKKVFYKFADKVSK